MAILTSSDKSVARPRIELDENRITIGRHPECEVQIDEGAVSRRHAAISYRENAYFLEDLSSRNGTFLNEEKISSTTRLFDGARIKICDVSFVFQAKELKRYQTGPATEERSSQSLELPSFTLHDDMATNINSQLEPSSHHPSKDSHVSADDKLSTLIKVAQTLSESLERDEVLSKILDILFESVSYTHLTLPTIYSV